MIMMFEKVLVPTDFSRYALKMLDCIGEIPGPREVVLLNVVDAGKSHDAGEKRLELQLSLR